MPFAVHLGLTMCLPVCNTISASAGCTKMHRMSKSCVSRSVQYTRAPCILVCKTGCCQQIIRDQQQCCHQGQKPCCLAIELTPYLFLQSWRSSSDQESSSEQEQGVLDECSGCSGSCCAVHIVCSGQAQGSHSLSNDQMLVSLVVLYRAV